MSLSDWNELLRAAQKGDLSLIKQYINNGANPNYQHPEFLTTPLIESVQFGHLHVAEYLLENGADPRLKSGLTAYTALSVAEAIQNNDMVQLLKNYLNPKST